jgi:hypothetical protein
VVPEIEFTPDTSFEYSHQIETLLADPVVARDLAAPHDDDGEDGPDEGAGGDSGDDSGAASGDGGRRGA